MYKFKLIDKLVEAIVYDIWGYKNGMWIILDDNHFVLVNRSANEPSYIGVSTYHVSGMNEYTMIDTIDINKRDAKLLRVKKLNKHNIRIDIFKYENISLVAYIDALYNITFLNK